MQRSAQFRRTQQGQKFSSPAPFHTSAVKHVQPAILGVPCALDNIISNCAHLSKNVVRASPAGVVRQACNKSRRSVLVQASAAVQSPVTSQRVFKYRSFTAQGNMMSATVAHGDDGAVLTISLDAEQSAIPYLHWGLYRSPVKQWHHPAETVPPGSSLDKASGGMRSPMQWNPSQGCYTTTLRVPAALLPLHLACVFFYPDASAYETPSRGQHFTLPIGMDAGRPDNLGVSITSVNPTGSSIQEGACSVNFAVFSRHATSVSLCLAVIDPDSMRYPNLSASGTLEIALDSVTNKTGDVWHICIHNLRNLQLLTYAWRAEGEHMWQGGIRYHSGYLLADPQTTRAVPVLLPRASYENAPKLLPNFDASQPVIMSSLAPFIDTFQWGPAFQPLAPSGAPISRSLEQTIIMELDIDTFTQGGEADKSVQPDRRGKFLGVLDRVKEIASSGATAVLLSPVCWSKPGPGPWSRNPIMLSSPDPKYALGGALSAANELKMVIAGLHAAGLEVLLSVEYCIMAEGQDATSGGLQGMRGLDASVYYRPVSETSVVLAAGHPVVRPMILECLKTWAQEYCIDGFCFVHADNLTQDQYGSVLDNPPLAEDICHDPVLSGLKLIAAPSNTGLLPRGGVRGFPHWGRWQQLNDRFAPAVWSHLVNNQPGLLSNMATRIAGSSDLFGPDWDSGLPGGLAPARRAAFGINTLTSLGDKALMQALGGEGDLNRVETIARTLLLAQFTSAGCPMISASTCNRKGLWRFASLLATLRSRWQALLNPPITFSPPPEGTVEGSSAVRELTWHSMAPGMDIDWNNAQGGAFPSNAICFTVHDPSNPVDSLLVALNPYDQPLLATLPLPEQLHGTYSLPGQQLAWRLVVDTTLMPPDDINPNGPVLPPQHAQYQIGAKGGILLSAVALPRSGSTIPTPPGPTAVA